MLRHVQPRRVVEVGSGYSSAMMLDTAEGWLDPDVDITFIEPYDELLRSLLRPGDDERVTILDSAVQDVDLVVFTRLEAGDILFIDSTHVVKAGSDVNHLFFEVLPRWRPAWSSTSTTSSTPSSTRRSGCGTVGPGTRPTCCGPSSCTTTPSRSVVPAPDVDAPPGGDQGQGCPTSPTTRVATSGSKGP